VYGRSPRAADPASGVGGNLRARAGSQSLISMSKESGLSACVASDVAAEEMYGVYLEPIKVPNGQSEMVKEIKWMSSW
jgi:hypothetical protein